MDKEAYEDIDEDASCKIREEIEGCRQCGGVLNFLEAVIVVRLRAELIAAFTY